MTPPPAPSDRPTQPVGAPDLTVVIPAYNEQGAIAETVREIDAVLRGTGRAFEIIVVDDGSTDGTAEAATAGPCRVIRNATNMGYGSSLKRGIGAAAAPLVVITDGDGTYPAGDIPRLLALAGDFDMVVGARTGQDVNIPVVRRPAKAFIRGLASYLSGKPIPDLNSGLRLMRRADVLRFARILPSGFSFTTTITLALLCNDYRVGWVPIDYRKRVGVSKIRPRHAWDFTLLILRAIVLFNPLKVFLPLGTLMATLGGAKLTWDLFWGKGKFSESAVMSILAAIIVWCVGLLADQNTRIGLDVRAWEERR